MLRVILAQDSYIIFLCFDFAYVRSTLALMFLELSYITGGEPCSFITYLYNQTMAYIMFSYF